METQGEQSASLTRRDFLVYALSVSGALGATGLLAPIARYAFPTVKAEAAVRVRVASTTQLTPLDKVVDFDYQDVPCTVLQLEDGAYVAGPPPSPLPTLKLAVEGEDIWVEGWSSS